MRRERGAGWRPDSGDGAARRWRQRGGFPASQFRAALGQRARHPGHAGPAGRRPHPAAPGPGDQDPGAAREHHESRRMGTGPARRGSQKAGRIAGIEGRHHGGGRARLRPVGFHLSARRVHRPEMGGADAGARDDRVPAVPALGAGPVGRQAVDCQGHPVLRQRAGTRPAESLTDSRYGEPSSTGAGCSDWSPIRRRQRSCSRRADRSRDGGTHPSVTGRRLGHSEPSVQPDGRGDRRGPCRPARVGRGRLSQQRRPGTFPALSRLVRSGPVPGRVAVVRGGTAPLSRAMPVRQLPTVDDDDEGNGARCGPRVGAGGQHSQARVVGRSAVREGQGTVGGRGGTRPEGTGGQRAPCRRTVARRLRR